MVHHPSPSDLLAFVRGELTEAELAAVERHLAGCPPCCAAAGDLDSEDPFIYRLRTAMQPAPTEPVIDPPAGGRPTVPGYDLVRELGRGGMGVVYEARQAALNRTVAVKVLRDAASAEPEDVSRFRAEVLALARVDHPHVVQVYDSGTVDGRPFVVLEYVAGGTLADDCRGVPQAPAEAARLLEEIARGVQAVHDAGVIHRDLKPSNVFLEPPNRVPKIGDFGIAKFLDRSTYTTATGFSPGTPRYMAPEQATNQPVGPATDVYSLGVILYELLTGRTPLEGASAVETLDMVRTQEPLPPTWLNRAIPADLETICLKCLQKEPAARYATAAALADDLRRYREGRPIAARPVGYGERAIRWCRRNPRLAVLTGLVAALVTALGVGGIAVGVVFSRTAEEQKELATKADAARRLAEGEQARARAEAERATQVTRFLTSLFEPGDELFVGSACLGFRNPKDAEGINDFLKLGVAKLNGPDGFRDRPLVRAELLYKIGLAYMSLGRGRESEAMLDEAVRLRRANLPTAHPDLGDALLAYAQVRSLLDDEVNDDLFREALAITAANDDPDGLKRANAETAYAFFSVYLGGVTEDAVRQMERAYAVRERVLGATSLKSITTLLALIVHKVQQEKTQDAVALMVKLTAALEEARDQSGLLACCRQMAATYSTWLLAGRAGTVGSARKLVAQFAATVGDAHFLTVHAKGVLADLLAGRDQVAAYRDCLRCVESWGTPSLYLRAKFTLDVALATAEDAGVAASEGELRKAIDLFRRLAKKKGQGRHEYPYALQRLARALVLRRDAAADAEVGALLDEGAAHCRANARVDGYRRAFSFTDAGHWRLEHGDAATCADLCGEAAKLWRADPRPVAPGHLAEALALQSLALARLGRADDAEAARREAADAIRRFGNDRATHILRAKEMLAGRLPPWRTLWPQDGG